MDEAFELADLEDLTFEMEIPFEDLGSRRKSGKVRELIQWCQRRKMIPTLLQTLTELRDEIDWYEAAGLS